MISTYSFAVTDAANELLGKEGRWVTTDVLDKYDVRRDLKKRRCVAEGEKEYREANKNAKGH